MVLRLVPWVIVAMIATARAEPRTTAAVSVRKTGSAKARAVGKLPANTAVEIEKEAGAWIKVRARVGKKQIVGYVERDKVAEPAALVVAPAEDDSEEGFVAPAASTPRKTLESVVVRKKPGEKQAAAGTLAADTVVQIEGEKGRWLKIRAGAITGYVARTTVSGSDVATDTSAIETPPPAPAVITPQRRWRRAEDGGNDALAIEATAATTLRADAKPDAAALAQVAPGARLVVVDATVTAGFIRVRDTAGQEGWILREHVGNGSAGSALAAAPARVATSTPAHVEVVAPAAPQRTPRRLAVRIDAGIGYRVLGMDFTSNGSNGLANYVASADASAADVDFDVALRMPGRLVLGFDARLGVSRSSPGLDYPGPSGPPGEIAFSTIAVDAGIRGGVRLRRMFELSVRAGAHYDAFMTKEIENAGTLPRERLLGTTLGARVDIVPPRTRVSATLHVDAFVVGNRRQTAGLEDGTSSTARAVWAGLTARFALARRFSLQGAYDFGRATTEWSGMSVRDPGVTSARRVDSTQLVQIGISVEL